MAERGAFGALGLLVLALVVVQATSGATPGNETAQSQAQEESSQTERAQREQDRELEPVHAEGYRPIDVDRQLLVDWLSRIPGKFEVSGTMHFHRPDGDMTTVATGRADCAGLRAARAPAVHCDLDVRWPPIVEVQPAEDAASTFRPAAIVLGYGLDRDHIIHHLLVDGRGQAEGGAGNLVSADMLVSRSGCLSAPSPCQRIVRITARSDLSQVKMEMEVEIGTHKMLTQTFVLQRESTQRRNQ